MSMEKATRSVSGDDESAPVLADKKRYHDLDALRGFAMLLGIVLHGLMSFMPIPLPVPQDINQSPEIYGYVFNIIHGFRMPLFFLISGFFTAMLWRKRGLRNLLKHRAKRILLPLVVAVPVLWLSVILLVFPVGKWKAESRKPSAQGQEANIENTIWGAARRGDIEAIKKHLAEEGADVNATGGKSWQSTPLRAAAIYGHAKAVQLLIEEGADVNATASPDRATALSTAVFFGHTETVKLLIECGADLNTVDIWGLAPLDLAQATGTLSKLGFEAARLPYHSKREWEDVKEARLAIAKMLKKAGARSEGMTASGFLALVFILGAFVPVTAHLWFLNYLFWLVLGFALIIRISHRFKWKPCPSWMIRSPWLWLVPLTLLPQIFTGLGLLYMDLPIIGPDTFGGLMPWPPQLIYYGVFFGFGAICYGREEFDHAVGRRWRVYLVLAIPALLLSMHWVELRNVAIKTGLEANQSKIIWYHFLTSLCQLFFAWLMIFGFIGLFRRCFAVENKKVRYISDASYWIYLAHLPLIVILQFWVSDWPYPSFLKFLFICGVAAGILLLIYEYAIRYTWVGTMLNGKRTRKKATT